MSGRSTMHGHSRSSPSLTIARATIVNGHRFQSLQQLTATAAAAVVKRDISISVNIAVLQLAVTQAGYSQISALYGRRSSPQRKRKIILLHFACRRRRKMYCGYARLPVCLSAAVCPQYCTDPDVAWRSGRGCPLVVRCWADLQSVHGLCCYGNITRTLVTSCFHSAI